MSNSPIAEAIKISQNQAGLLSALMRLSPSAPVDTVTRLALKDPSFCDRILDILFPRRRPPSITEAIIHESIRSLGVQRVRFLFLCNSLSNAFSTVRLENFSPGEFWVHSFRRGFTAFILAEKLDYDDYYEAFLAGFLADIGNLLLAARFPHLGIHLRDIRSRPYEIRAHIERILTGVTHAEEVKRSNLAKLIPPRIMQAVSSHLSPFPGDDRQKVLTCITSAAVAISDIAQAYPKEYIVDQAESNLELFDTKLDIKEIFTVAETRANTLAQDLGYDVPATSLLFDDILNPSQDTGLEEDDPLAHLFQFSAERQLDNRAGYLQKLAERLTQLKEDKNFSNNRESFSIILIDIDGFSKLNATYGCPTADGLLQQLAQQIAQSMRTMDNVARIDTDRFALILPRTQAMGAKVVAERIRALVRGNTIAMGTIRPNCTASVGGITVVKDKLPDNHIALWDELNNQLKAAKSRGKNRIIWSQ
jgi:diguanylate cyclase (GGDEF)-like protein